MSALFPSNTSAPLDPQKTNERGRLSGEEKVRRVEMDFSKLNLVDREKSSVGFGIREPDRTILQQRATIKVERGTGMPLFGTQLSSPGTLINSTISKDNTKGEQARQRALLADFGSKSSRRDPNLLLISQRSNGSGLPPSKPTTSISNISNTMASAKIDVYSTSRLASYENMYDAVEQVLHELSVATDFSTPFLNRVSKREAPDYFDVIARPMDLGTMTKKLKMRAYKSKSEVVADLNLIWSNCLKYNTDLAHPLRRNAIEMRKLADILVQTIPGPDTRPRAEVEAEERRRQNEDGEGDESDDEPRISSRIRKARELIQN